MSQVTLATTIATPPMIDVPLRALLITVTVMHAGTSVGQGTFGQHDVVLPPQLALRNTMRGLVGLTTLSQQQEPQS